VETDPDELIAAPQYLADVGELDLRAPVVLVGDGG